MLVGKCDKTLDQLQQHLVPALGLADGIGKFNRLFGNSPQFVGGDVEVLTPGIFRGGL
jgi:hypothetical protein